MDTAEPNRVVFGLLLGYLLLYIYIYIMMMMMMIGSQFLIN